MNPRRSRCSRRSLRRARETRSRSTTRCTGRRMPREYTGGHEVIYQGSYLVPSGTFQGIGAMLFLVPLMCMKVGTAISRVGYPRLPRRGTLMRCSPSQLLRRCTRGVDGMSQSPGGTKGRNSGCAGSMFSLGWLMKKHSLACSKKEGR